MEMEARKTPRFWIAVQPSIIRLYKVAGLFALGAILVGLLGFLAVNIFYYFDHTWVRPVVLTLEPSEGDRSGDPARRCEAARERARGREDR